MNRSDLQVNQLPNSAAYTVSSLTGPQRKRCTYDQTQQAVEDRNSLGNHPSQDPKYHPQRTPRPQRCRIALVDAVTAGPDAHVDLLAGGVAEDDPRDDNLPVSACGSLHTGVWRRPTDGNATPYATRRKMGPIDPNAGDETLSPA